MRGRPRAFKDPKGKFMIIIPPNWKYHKNDDSTNRGLFQFKVSPDCVFQISCKPINDHISNMISANKIKAHDFNMPNLSFKESYHETEAAHTYMWVSVVDDHFLMAIYYYNPSKKPKKDIGLDLMDVRMCLQKLFFNRSDEEKKQKSSKSEEGREDYTDIKFWRNKPNKYMASRGGENKLSGDIISPVQIDVLKLYALLKSKISQKPNGFFDLLRIGLPLDNMIWWDFVLECDKGWIQVWRTPHAIEAAYDFDGEFNLVQFFEQNIKRYSDDLSNIIKSFDRHTMYINHYRSYKDCVRTLWEEISVIDLTPPTAPKQHISQEKELQNYSKEFPLFTENSIKYHALAKSLVLNAAFQIESYLNLLIRVGSTKELKLYPDVLKRFLRLDFSSKAKNLTFYTCILINEIDLENKVYRDAKELMTLRNKYVHFDEDSLHNKLGEILYDDNYPLHPTEEGRPAIESIKQMFHKPDLEIVKKAHETANKFVSHLESLMHPEIKEDMIFLLEQNPIGYNESIGAYSAVNNPRSLDFFTSYEKTGEVKNTK